MLLLLLINYLSDIKWAKIQKTLEVKEVKKTLTVVLLLT